MSALFFLEIQRFAKRNHRGTEDLQGLRTVFDLHPRTCDSTSLVGSTQNSRQRCFVERSDPSPSSARTILARGGVSYTRSEWFERHISSHSQIGEVNCKQ